MDFRTQILAFSLALGMATPQNSAAPSTPYASSAFHYMATGVRSIYSDPGNRWIMGFTFVGAAAAYSVDQEVKDYAQKNGLMSEEFSRFGDLYGGQYAHWVLFSALLGHGILRSVPGGALKRQFIYSFSAMAVNGALTAGLKIAVGRERPNGRGFRSFPSGHTSHSFTVATVANEVWGPSVGIPAYLIGGLVALQRIHDNKHYLSDVIAGAGLGTVVGRGFAYAYRESDSRLSVFPIKNGLKLVYRF